MKNATKRFGMAVAALGLMVGSANAELIVTTTNAAFQANAAAAGATLTTQNFNSAAIGATVVDGITLTGDASIQGSQGGRFGHDQEIYSMSHSSFTLTFATSINQLGFQLFDLGTIDATTFTATLSNGDSAILRSNYQGLPGNQLFEGLSDKTSFKSVTFTNTVVGDLLGIDDASFGPNAIATPEPATIVSAGIAGLMGLGYNWRRRKAKLAA